jgi:protein phosphatase
LKKHHRLVNRTLCRYSHCALKFKMVTSSFGLTDCGRGREHNEDAFLTADDLGLYAVADGLGGMQAGEIASQLAVDELKRFVAAHQNAPPWEREGLMKDAFTLINRHILELAQQRPDRRGMATTLTACWLGQDEATLMHAGDSAAFLIRNCAMKQFSRDHTIKAALRAGLIPPAGAKPKLLDHALTRCLGYRADDQPDTARFQIQDGDKLLLCTDGLLRYVEQVEILEICVKMDDLAAAGRILIDLANAKGGQDNITVVLVRIGIPRPNA